MTATEQKNYQIAVAISVLFHLALILIYIPQYLVITPGVDTVSAELVDFSAGIEPAKSVTTSKSQIKAPEVTKTEPVKSAPKLQQQKELTPSKEKVKENISPKEEVKEIVKPKEEVKEVIKPKEEVKSVEPVEKKVEPAKQPTPEATETPKNSKSVVSGGSDGKNGKETSSEDGNGDLAPKGPVIKNLGDGSGMVSKQGSGLKYTKYLMNLGKEGETVLRVFLKPDGSIERVQFKTKSEEIDLDRASESFIRNYWKFKPNEEAYFVDLSFHFAKENWDIKVKYLGSQTRP